MTRTKAFKDYIKKFYNIDAEGMTPTDVVQDFLMKQYGHDSTANSLTSAIVEMIDNDLGPGSGGGGLDPNGPIKYVFNFHDFSNLNSDIWNKVDAVQDGDDWYVLVKDRPIRQIVENDITILFSIDGDQDNVSVDRYIVLSENDRPSSGPFSSISLVTSKGLAPSVDISGDIIVPLNNATISGNDLTKEDAIAIFKESVLNGTGMKIFGIILDKDF